MVGRIAHPTSGSFQPTIRLSFKLATYILGDVSDPSIDRLQKIEVSLGIAPSVILPVRPFRDSVDFTLKLSGRIPE